MSQYHELAELAITTKVWPGSCPEGHQTFGFKQILVAHYMYLSP